MKIDYDAVGGRRFLLTVGCGVVTSVLLWFGKLTSDAYAMLQMGTVAAYITGNVVQRVKAPDSVTSATANAVANAEVTVNG